MLKLLFLFQLMYSLNGAASGLLLLEHYQTRDSNKYSQISINENNKCSVYKFIGKPGGNQSSFIKPGTKIFANKKCDYIKAAKEIESRLGMCNKRGLELSRDKGIVEILSLSGSDENGLLVAELERDSHPIYWILPHLDQSNSHINFAVSHDNSQINQGCLCVKAIAKKSRVGLGVINPFGYIYGPYYNKNTKVFTVSANECADMFETDYEKEVVREVFKKYQLN